MSPLTTTRNLAARFTVLGTLCDPIIARISFVFGSWVVTPSLFGEVASAVSSGKVKVEFNDKLNGRAAYYGGSNQIDIGFMATSDILKRALIVHEAVHAGFDIRKFSTMRVATSEAAGFLAQCTFARAYLAKPDDPEYRLYDDDPNKDLVFEIGWRLAEKVLASRKVTIDDYREMWRAVLKHPDYGADGRDLAEWNGVGGPS